MLLTYFWKRLPTGASIWLAPIWLISPNRATHLKSPKNDKNCQLTFGRIPCKPDATTWTTACFYCSSRDGSTPVCSHSPRTDPVCASDTYKVKLPTLSKNYKTRSRHHKFTLVTERFCSVWTLWNRWHGNKVCVQWEFKFNDISMQYSLQKLLMAQISGWRKSAGWENYDLPSQSIIAC